MDPRDERSHDSAASRVFLSRAHSPRAANSLDDALSSQFGDREHDDVVWDDTSEYECLHSDSSVDRRAEEEQARGGSTRRGDAYHATRSFSSDSIASSRRSETGSPNSDSTTTTAAVSMDNASTASSPPSPRSSSLLSAEGITQADDARLAELLRKCLGSRTNISTAEETVLYDGIYDDCDDGDDGEVEYEDDYEDEQEEEEGPEEGEIPAEMAPAQWELHRPAPPPTASSTSSSPLPSSSSDSSYRQPARSQRQQQQQPFSMDQFLRGAIATSGKGTRSSLQPGISPSRVAQMTNRFRLHEERRARRLAAKRRDAETQQCLGFSYAPSINGNSRRLTRHAPAFLERQHSFLTRKQQHAQHEASKKQRVSDRALELQARVRTPCICNRGGSIVTDGLEGSSSNPATLANPPRFDAGGLRSPAASPDKSMASGPTKESPTASDSGHSQACQRFMAMCEKMNASFAIQRKKERMRRSVDDMLEFQRAKQQRQQERAAQLLARETKEETFAPRINPQSERICAALVESGRLDAEITRRVLRQRKAIPLPPRLTFQPTISIRSRRLMLQRQKRADRCSEGLTATEPGSTLQVGRDAKAGSKSPDVFARLQSPGVWPAPVTPVSGSAMKAAVDRKKTASSEARLATATTPEVWTEVKFDAAKHAFILRGLELERAFA